MAEAQDARFGQCLSPITRGIYNLALDEFMVWYTLEPRPGFSRATVNAWRVTLEVRRLSSSSINVRLCAVRKLAVEAAQNGLLEPGLAAGILSVSGVKKLGVGCASIHVPSQV